MDGHAHVRALAERFALCATALRDGIARAAAVEDTGGAAVYTDISPGVDKQLLQAHFYRIGAQGAPSSASSGCCFDKSTLKPEALRQLAGVLQPPSEHPHGLSDKEFNVLLTQDKPLIFAFHGYPWLIHRLTYCRTNHHNLHVRGYKEAGTMTTPFDMALLNDLDRFHLVADVIDRVSKLGVRAAYAKQAIRDKLLEHTQYITEHGEDLPDVRHWQWNDKDWAMFALCIRGQIASMRRERTS